MKVLTWNIHGFVGRGRRYAPERTAKVIDSCDADIVALQEVDTRGQKQDALAALSNTQHIYQIDAPTLTDDYGWYGQLLLSKHPIVSSSVHDVSVSGFEPRRAIETHFRVQDATLRVIATHLGLKRAERRKQFEMIRNILAEDIAMPTVLLGDFNEWRPNNIELSSTMAGAHSTTASLQRTFPSIFPLVCLDRIASAPASLLKDVGVVRIDPGASDHLPVLGKLNAEETAP